MEHVFKATREDDVAGATIGPDSVVTGVPNWAEVTRDQRMSQKATTHVYPPGLAKSTRWHRDDVLPAERFLGAFNRGAPGAFPADAIDEVAEHLLLWLRERGFRVVPVEE